MKKSILYSTILVFFLCQFGNAQIATEEETKKNKLGFEAEAEKYPLLNGVLFGVHGARETMIEIGYFQYQWGNAGYGDGGKGYSISTEHYINDDYIIAPKIAGFSNLWGINLGAAAVWYFDMEKNNSFRVRPEIGYGTRTLKLTYAFNIAVTNKDMPNVSKHMISAVYFLNFNKKSRKSK
ncbi:hypothetical protein U8527_18930 [Kordia algicida OT-1]|uniref:Uncharacterized protein n=1 Tax=Kordia algicida OT-1 TaxID=391587 RepID=A9DJD1_9FLAO|nr:hypothetical protein [Kordia algicida]EDP98077.1 hypothetical protein KAOT1_12707 [Kordia algicida OT-1]